MNFKLEFKHNLESRICNGNQPIVNSEIIKSKLNFTTDDSNTRPVASTSNKRFKLIFAKSAYFMVSLIMGIFVGGGIVYGLTNQKDSITVSINDDSEKHMGLSNKETLLFDIQLGAIPVCASFISEVTMNNLVYSEIINKNNIQTLESVIFTNNMEVLYTPVDHDISVTFASMVLCNNNNIDYIYLLTKDEYLSRYRLESNLPYTSQELITSFESKLGSTLTTEFLNGKDTGIFSQLKYDTYSHQYYLEHELRYEDSTYIAKYDFEQEQIVVKTLI